MTIETTTRITVKPASTENSATVGKEDTGRLVFGRIKVNRKTMMLTASLWEPHYVDKYKNITSNTITDNCWETAVRNFT